MDPEIAAHLDGELTEDRRKLIVDYSMGMKKKTALAAALIHRPKVMFMDEPFNGIDPISVRAIRQALQNARVELNGPGGRLVARTDVNGRFAFSNLPPGDYRIDVTRDGIVSVLQDLRPDVVFNALHGKWGEDGCAAAIMETLQIPYTHSGVLASSLAGSSYFSSRTIFGLSTSLSSSSSSLMASWSERVKSQPTCRCRRRPSTNSLSISRPPRHSA